MLALQLVGAGPGFADPKLAAGFAFRATAALENPGIRFVNIYRPIGYPMRRRARRIRASAADVVVRAYRAIGVDLQRLVHEDMKRHFALYLRRPAGACARPTPNIDHRRVLNLRVFFARHGKIAGRSRPDPKDYKPGDLVTWNLDPSRSLPHIGIVTQRRSADGTRPLIMHNAGGGQVFQDMIFLFKITGHYRYGID